MHSDKTLAFLAGGGEMGALMRAHAWEATALGTVSGWSQSLRTAVRLLLNTRHPMYLFWGFESTCLYNDAYRQSIGPEMHPGSLGRAGREVWQEIWPTIGPQIEQVMQGQDATWPENQRVPIARNGQREDVYWTFGYSPIDDEHALSGVGGVMVLCTEATQQIESTRHLAYSEQRLQLALAAGGGIGTWDWDVQNDRVTADERFARLYGVDPALAQRGAPIAEFLRRVHPLDLPRLEQQVQTSLKTGAALSVEYRLVNTGITSWVIAEGRCEFAQDGKPWRLSGISFDITLRKANELRLLDLNSELERKVIERSQTRGTTWQFSPDLLGSLNSEGYFQTSNPAWQKVLGWSEQEVASMSIFELLHPDDVERTRAGFQLTQQGKPAIRFPNRYRCKDGSYRWISWVGIPEDGLVYCSGREVTEEIEQAQELKDAQEALQQSQKMDALGQLTGGIAHDFNNMLQGIVLPLQLIRRRLASHQALDLDRYVQAGLDSAQRAASLTQRLLAFSRRQPLVNKSVDLQAAMRGLREIVVNAAGENIQVVIDIEDGLWMVNTDVHQFESALINLAINARDAMPDGGTITLCARNVPTDKIQSPTRDELTAGDYVMVSVKDTGVGMPASVAAQAFEPFFTTKPIGQGTGLGLSMIYGYAKQSHGTVKINSTEGKGTTVELLLPRSRADVVQEADGIEEPVSRSLEGGRIMVVEDDEVIRQMVVELLRESGYEVTQAADGKMAMTALERMPSLDMLVSDVGLPGPNGRQVADYALERFPGVRIIFMTGYAAAVATGSDVISGKAELLVKPFDMNALLKKVEQMFRG